MNLKFVHYTEYVTSLSYNYFVIQSSLNSSSYNQGMYCKAMRDTAVQRLCGTKH